MKITIENKYIYSRRRKYLTFNFNITWIANTASRVNYRKSDIERWYRRNFTIREKCGKTLKSLREQGKYWRYLGGPPAPGDEGFSIEETGMNCGYLWVDNHINGIQYRDPCYYMVDADDPKAAEKSLRVWEFNVIETMKLYLAVRSWRKSSA